MCFLCLWDSRDDKHHYMQKDWPLRAHHVIGKHNVQRKALVDRNKIYLPPLHIKLELVKNFVKAMDFGGTGFKCIQEKFGAVSTRAKLKAGIFVGPQAHKLIRDPVFEIELSRREKPAWKALVDVIECFLGSYRAENYKDIVSNLLQKYKAMGCRMSLKLHFLHTHLDFFPPKLGDVNDEHGERFHQDISIMEM